MQFKYKFKDKSLFDLALTQSGVNHINNNERLEFLGDAILEHLMSEYLFNKFPEKAEGELTKIRSQRVCEDALFAYAEHSAYLRVHFYGIFVKRSHCLMKKSVLKFKIMLPLYIFQKIFRIIGKCGKKIISR